MNKKIVLCLLTGLSASFLAVFAGTSNTSFSSFYTKNAARNNTYGLELEPFNELSNVDTILTSAGNSIVFSYTGYSNQSNNWGVLAHEGNVANQTALSGLESISVSCLGVNPIECTISYGWYQDEYVVSETFDSANIFFDFNNEQPTFFKVENKSESSLTISSIHLCYSCQRTDIPDPYKDKLIYSPYESGYSVSGFEQGIVDAVIPSTHAGLPVLAISPSAFYYCTTLKSVVISDGVASIGNGAFGYCASLSSIVIPDSVVTIGTGAFSECYNFTNIFYGGSSEQWNNVDIVYSNYDYYLKEANIEFNTDITQLNYVATEKYGYVLSNTNKLFGFEVLDRTITSFDFQDDLKGLEVKSLSGYAFRYCTLLSSIAIPNSVVIIGTGAFSGCTSLISIDIPNSVTMICGGAFRGCSALDSITLPNSISLICSETFVNCTSLASVYIPHSVTAIEGEAFRGCTSLTSIIIPDSVISMGKRSFRNCGGTIYCEADSKPEGWDSDWTNGFDGNVVWGYK